MKTLREQAGQLLTIGFEGQECGPDLKSLLQEIQPGGVIFFQRNIATVEQFRVLVSQIREVLGDSRPFLAIDQEGGQVDRFRELLGPLPSAREAAQAGMAFELGDLAGRELAAFGLNMDFAPVLDLASPESRSILGTRTAGDNPHQVIQFATEFLRALGGWNVGGCAKHFPGLGGGRNDSHIGLPRINKSFDILWEKDLLPFRTLARPIPGMPMPMMMVAHAEYPELERVLGKASGLSTDLTPASLSHNIVTGLLRNRIGYEGTIVCDDLDMGGALEGRTIEEAAVAAVYAGCDILLVCRQSNNAQRIHRALVVEAEKSTAFADLMKPSRGVSDAWISSQISSYSTANLEVLRRNIALFSEEIQLRLDSHGASKSKE
jgi:beta-N-acetylhexosaminidase